MGRGGGRGGHPSKSHARVPVSVLRVCNKTLWVGTGGGGRGGARILKIRQQLIVTLMLDGNQRRLICFWPTNSSGGVRGWVGGWTEKHRANGECVWMEREMFIDCSDGCK